jgi:hypothetical protein
VTEEIAHSLIIIFTDININKIIIIIITIISSSIANRITTTLQASACCRWQKFLSQRVSLHVTEQAFWGKSTNLDILTNCRAAMSVMVKLNKIECRR